MKRARGRVLVLAVPAVLVAMAACAEPHPDDGGPDPATVVTVRATDRAGAPVAGVDVYGHDGAWALVAQAVTGADGLAVLEVPAGGAITAHEVDPEANPEFVTPRWFTALEVAPGDLIDVPVWRGQAQRRLIEVTAPPLPPGAVRFYASAPCGSSDAGTTGPATLGVDLRCPGRGPVVLTAYADGNEPVAYLELADVDLTAPALAVTGAWAPAGGTTTVEVRGFPAEGGWAQVSREALAGGYPFHWSSGSVRTTETSGSVTLPRPALGDGAVHRVTVTDGDFCDTRTRTLTRSRASDGDRVTVDLGAMLAPITDVTIGAGRLSWAGGGDGASGVSLWFEAMRGNGDVGGPSRTWQVVAPPGTTSVDFPTDVGFTWPAGQAAGDRVSSVFVSDISSTYWTSYADVRQRAAIAPLRVEGDFESRFSSISKQYASLGCPLSP